MVSKSVLRKVYLEKRIFLSDEEYELRSRLVRENFLRTYPPESFESLHVFLPITEKKEVNTWLIIHEVRKRNPDIQIYVSKSLKNGILHHYLLEEDTRLRVSPWGIPEPDGYEPITPGHVDIILVPLVISDRSGHRIGYGMGYYDRFLNEVSSTHQVGLTLSPPLDEIKTAEDHDVRLSACIGPYLSEFFQ
ncbi:5-formyltetrahydrofolate cyclo-ligase [Fulvivirga sedimenti]|uniref:5-formyltetrahydrofolate cyclo-ligase n=1 Tax=Fulvivirga sedimenti TaxID=2879465 RepID=A0A9X1HW71_9BACT|nr:5-formyltetrahydrofolate cyclo-ligase [Fulvivirga sedimenti]MCA6078981.1 5-formyltetrahydrofolate cyclo-ligase [Fulvivirga sedimenti]